MRLAENALTKEIWPRPSAEAVPRRQFRAGGTLRLSNARPMFNGSQTAIFSTYLLGSLGSKTQLTFLATRKPLFVASGRAISSTSPGGCTSMSKRTACTCAPETNSAPSSCSYVMSSEWAHWKTLKVPRYQLRELQGKGLATRSTKTWYKFTG